MALPMSFTPGWQNRLRMGKESLFRIIDLTISVAASKWPDDLKQRRPLLVDMLFSPPTGDDDALHSAAGKQRPVSSSSIAKPPEARKVSVLRDKEATQKGAQKTEPEKRPLMKTTSRSVVRKRDDEKAKPPSSAHGLESERREACSIKKLNDRYREEEPRKRKIQVIASQESIPPPCSTSTKKPRKYF